MKQLEAYMINRPKYYRISDGIWDTARACFVDYVLDGIIVVPLYDGGTLAGVDYLRQTLNFYGFPVGVELMELGEVKAAKIAKIDAETSAAIIAGFDYEVNGTPYHFSYDAFDQQNFVDTVSMCQLALAGTPGLPASVTWNSYTVPGGELVQQTFDAASFLKLYTAGAMVHKAACMAEGGERKAKVAVAQTVEDVESA